MGDSENDIYIDCSPVGESTQAILYTDNRDSYNPKKYFEKITNNAGKILNKLSLKTIGVNIGKTDPVDNAATRTNDDDVADPVKAEDLFIKYRNYEEQRDVYTPGSPDYNSLNNLMKEVVKEWNNDDDKEGFISKSNIEGLKTNRGVKISIKDYAKVRNINDAGLALNITGKNASKLMVNLTQTTKKYGTESSGGLREYRRRKIATDVGYGIMAGILSVALFNRAFNKLTYKKELDDPK